MTVERHLLTRRCNYVAIAANHPTYDIPIIPILVNICVWIPKGSNVPHLQVKPRELLINPNYATYSDDLLLSFNHLLRSCFTGVGVLPQSHGLVHLVNLHLGCTMCCLVLSGLHNSILCTHSTVMPCQCLISLTDHCLLHRIKSHTEYSELNLNNCFITKLKAFYKLCRHSGGLVSSVNCFYHGYRVASVTPLPLLVASRTLLATMTSVALAALWESY